MIEYLEKNRIKFVYTPLIIYWLILLIATSIPGNDMPDIHMNDKFEHFLGYGLLTILINFSLLVQSKNKLLKTKAYLASIIIVSIYGALDELHQIFVPGRDCDFYDWITDFSAACFGIVMVYSLVKFVRIKVRNS